MGKIVKHFILLLMGCLNLNCQENAKEKSDDYSVYVHQIVSSFCKDMKKEYGLVCVGSGGRMPNKVEEISIRFHAYRRATINEARELMLASMQKLVDKVNANKKIRPYLMEYPFTWKGADISIAFHKRGGESSYYLDGSVAFACQARGGKLSYSAAEIQKRKLVDFIDFDGKIEVGEVVEREVFIDLMKESYEEALEIVANTLNKNKNLSGISSDL